jgi:thiamine-phosphate pyrophosphorylase
LLREPGRRVAQQARPGCLVHLKCADAPLPGLGLHLPSDADVGAWRARHDGLLGVSTHSLDQARAARDAGADYVILGPAFRPTSKPLDRRPTLGIRGLAEAQRALDIPVFALGGVDPERARALREAGVYGVAVLGLLARQPDLATSFDEALLG